MAGFEDYVKKEDDRGMFVINPKDFDKKYTKRKLLSSIVLPSQNASYAVCVEFAKNWFLSKFPHHFFNSVFVEGSHTFDEFRKFSDMNLQLKRSNPLLAIIPEIDIAHNRQWIDVNTEATMMMRRTRMEGTFFNDIRDNRGLHLQLQFKTVLMNFVFKLRLDTKAEQLDMLEYIKFNHRAGMSSNHELYLDVHVPRQIISQIAFDNGIKMYDDGTPVDSIEMLSYLNSHSLIPFLYKLRSATGNNEYFIKVPNCMARIKSELPTADSGERQDMVTSNYTIDFNVEIEMTAPYCYSYYSEKEQNFITNNPLYDGDRKKINVMQSIKTEVPSEDKNHWKMLLDEPMRYEIEQEDLNTEIDIDFSEQFADTDIGKLIEYSNKIKVSPYTFLNFKIFNDGVEVGYTMNWDTLKMHINSKAKNQIFVIAIYCDNEYINNAIIEMEKLYERSRIN